MFLLKNKEKEKNQNEGEEKEEYHSFLVWNSFAYSGGKLSILFLYMYLKGRYTLRTF
jgi:hypothetical protein